MVRSENTESEKLRSEDISIVLYLNEKKKCISEDNEVFYFTGSKKNCKKKDSEHEKKGAN